MIITSSSIQTLPATRQRWKSWHLCPSRTSSTTATTTTTTVSFTAFAHDSGSSSNVDHDDVTMIERPLPLPSIFPPETPAGLRGEAVRSALRSVQPGVVVMWRPQPQSWPFGWIQVAGSGCLDFLQSKFSNRFEVVQSNYSMSFDSSQYQRSIIPCSYQQACWLTPRGRVRDLISVAVINSEQALVFTSPGHDAQTLWQALDPFVFPLDQVTLTCNDDDQARRKTTSGLDDSIPSLFCLVSTRKAPIQTAFDMYIAPALQKQRVIGSDGSSPLWIDLPSPHGNQGLWIPFPSHAESYGTTTSSSGLLILPQALQLPPCVGAGYTFCFVKDGILGDDTVTKVATDVWHAMTTACLSLGPIEMGAAEWDTLRVEAGQPAYGKEMTAAQEETRVKRSKQHRLEKQQQEQSTVFTDTKASLSATPIVTAAASSLELFLYQQAVDPTKGCYLGQEGVAAQVKHPRGPPRTLYQVVFDDDWNVYHGSDVDLPQDDQPASSTIRVTRNGNDDDDDDGEEDETVENLTRIPQPGDTIYVLGSNETIMVGTLTSVAEPGSNGQACTLALALVRRHDSILKAMQQQELELTVSSSSSQNSNAINKKIDIPSKSYSVAGKLDPLHGLEVIVGGTHTLGRLQTLPRQQDYPLGSTMFDFENDITESGWGERIVNTPDPFIETIQDDDISGKEQDDDITAVNDDEDEVALQKAMQEAVEAQAKAEAAAAEAARKAAKMVMLQQRAAEAMARRKQQQQQQESPPLPLPSSNATASSSSTASSPSPGSPV